MQLTPLRGVLLHKAGRPAVVRTWAGWDAPTSAPTNPAPTASRDARQATQQPRWRALWSKRQGNNLWARSRASPWLSRHGQAVENSRKPAYRARLADLVDFDAGNAGPTGTSVAATTGPAGQDDAIVRSSGMARQGRARQSRAQQGKGPLSSEAAIFVSNRTTIADGSRRASPAPTTSLAPTNPAPTGPRMPTQAAPRAPLARFTDVRRTIISSRNPRYANRGEC